MKNSATLMHCHEVECCLQFASESQDLGGDLTAFVYNSILLQLCGDVEIALQYRQAA